MAPRLRCDGGITPVEIKSADTILVPIIKDKTGNVSSKANYRPIALTSSLSNVFETALLSKLESVFETSDYQFGFKSHHSTDLCIIYAEINC